MSRLRLTEHRWRSMQQMKKLAVMQGGLASTLSAMRLFRHANGMLLPREQSFYRLGLDYHLGSDAILKRRVMSSSPGEFTVFISGRVYGFHFRERLRFSFPGAFTVFISGTAPAK